MEIFFGYQFKDFINMDMYMSEALLQRAIAKRIITEDGAAYLRSIK